MAILKLQLEMFVRPECIEEAFSMKTPEEGDSAYKQSLLDTLRYMTVLSRKIIDEPQNKHNLSFAFQKYIANLDLIEKYFASRGSDSFINLVQANKKAFITHVNNGIEFKPILWNRALEATANALPPKYQKIVHNPPPQYRGGSAFFPDESPLTDKIELDRR